MCRNVFSNSKESAHYCLLLTTIHQTSSQGPSIPNQIPNNCNCSSSEAPWISVRSQTCLRSIRTKVWNNEKEQASLKTYLCLWDLLPFIMLQGGNHTWFLKWWLTVQSWPSKPDKSKIFKSKYSFCHLVMSFMDFLTIFHYPLKNQRLCRFFRWH